MKTGALTKLKEWQIDAIGLVLILALTAVAYFLIVAPARRAKLAMEAQTQDVAAQLAKNTELTGTTRTLGQQIAAAQRQIEQLGLILQPSSQQNQKLGQLMDLAAANLLDVDAIQPGALTAAAHCGTVPIRISGRGSYLSCFRFLKNMREKLPDCSVSAIELAGQPGPVPATGSFAVELKWFTAPAEATKVTKAE
jgi:Tfp pilus assembly protein PilO